MKKNRRVIFKYPMPTIKVADKVKKYITIYENIFKPAAQLEKEIEEKFGCQVVVLKQ